MLKLLHGIAALLCLTATAMAGTGSFRTDPQAWVRQNFVPSCHDPMWIEAPACNCMVPVIAERITEAEATRFIADPATARREISARINMQSITFFCIKAQKPPPL